MNPIYITLIIIGIALALIGVLLYIAILQLKLSIKKDDLAYMQALVNVRNELEFDIDCCTLWNSYNRLRYYASLKEIKDKMDELMKSNSTDDSSIALLERIHIERTKDYEHSLDYLTLLLALDTRILTLETHLKFQSPDASFNYITVANKFYSQRDHIERDIKELHHFRDSAAEYLPK